MKVKIGDFKKDNSKRKIKIRIDKWDTYEARSTLCEIIIPLLKQFKVDKKAIAWVDNEDVPTHLHNDGYTEDKWNWVLDEMIWSFEAIHADELDLDAWKKKITEEEYQKLIARKKNGLRLFAKYFESLWW